MDICFLIEILCQTKHYRQTEVPQQLQLVVGSYNLQLIEIEIENLDI